MNAMVLPGSVGHVDRVVESFVVTHQPRWAVSAARFVMLLGMTWWGLTACLLVGALAVVALRAWRSAPAAVVALAVGTLAARLGKAVVQRPRPPWAWAVVHPGGWSFPSTQATQTAAIAAAFIAASALSGRRRHLLTIVGITVVVVIGVSMVSLGAHWPSDVLAGWTLGTALGVVVGRSSMALPFGRACPSVQQRGTGSC